MSLFPTGLIFGQIRNGDFETWDTTYTGPWSSYLDSDFSVPDPKAGVVNGWTFDFRYGVSRTTDRHSGNYSLILHNIYQYVRQTINYKDTISVRPQFLQGYYKYITNSIKPSHGTITITLTRFNGLKSDTVGNGKFSFDSSNYFKPFELPLNYNSSLYPDSIHIFIKNADEDCPDQTMVCNLLDLDALTLTNSSLGLGDLKPLEARIIVYPNPTTNEFNIQNNLSQTVQFNLYNSLGEMITSKSLQTSTCNINLTDYPKGIYFYQITSVKAIIKTGMLLKQ